MKTLRTYLYDFPWIAILIVLWALGIVSYATYAVFTDMKEVSTQVATCYTALLGIPGVAFTFFQWRMKKESEKHIKFGD